MIKGLILLDIDRVGVSRIQLIVVEKLHWIFREQTISDYGVDALIEIRNDESPSGRLIAVQIKSGASYFSEVHFGNVVFRMNKNHMKYWTNYCLPVIVILYNPKTNVCIWEHVAKSKIIGTSSKNGKMLIKNNHYFSEESRQDLLDLTEKDAVYKRFDSDTGFSAIPRFEVTDNYLYTKNTITLDEFFEQSIVDAKEIWFCGRSLYRVLMQYECTLEKMLSKKTRMKFIIDNPESVEIERWYINNDKYHSFSNIEKSLLQLDRLRSKFPNNISVRLKNVVNDATIIITNPNREDSTILTQEFSRIGPYEKRTQYIVSKREKVLYDILIRQYEVLEMNSLIAQLN